MHEQYSVGRVAHSQAQTYSEQKCRGVANHSRVAECTRLNPEGEYSGVS